jgi:hypothetical protein
MTRSESKIKDFKFGISVTKVIISDEEVNTFYNVRVPVNGILPEYRDIMTEPTIRDTVIETDSQVHAYQIATMLEGASLIDVDRPL